MEDNFRSILIIISAIVIGAFFIHGLWTIRKNKNPYKLKTSKEVVPSPERDFDRSGFDQDGVGKITVKSKNATDEKNDEQTSKPNKNKNSQKETEKVVTKNIKQTNDKTLLVDDSPELELTSTDMLGEELKSTDSKVDPFIGQSTDSEFEYDNLNAYENLNNEAHEEQTDLPLSDALVEEEEEVYEEEIVLSSPVYDEPVIQPKVSTIAKTIKTRKKVSSDKAKLKRNQMEINFGQSSELQADVDGNVGQKEKLEPKVEDNKAHLTVKPEVLSLSVVMPQNQIIQGASLLPSLLTLGLKYGEMNIFHRHQDNAGNGPVTFSVANMLNPGSFDLDNMETFATQGITLFMMLPNSGNAFEVYEQMLSAAKQLAQEFQAQILDDKRNVMTKQTEQHYVSRIRDFEIKHRTAMV